VLAQYCRNLVWKDGQDLSPAYPGAILGGTPNPHPSGHCGNQCRSRRSSVEEVRGCDHRIVCVFLVKRYTSSPSPEETADDLFGGPQGSPRTDAMVGGPLCSGHSATCERLIMCLGDGDAF